MVLEEPESSENMNAQRRSLDKKLISALLNSHFRGEGIKFRATRYFDQHGRTEFGVNSYPDGDLVRCTVDMRSIADVLEVKPIAHLSADVYRIRNAAEDLAMLTGHSAILFKTIPAPYGGVASHALAHDPEGQLTILGADSYSQPALRQRILNYDRLHYRFTPVHAASFVHRALSVVNLGTKLYYRVDRSAANTKNCPVERIAIGGKTTNSALPRMPFELSFSLYPSHLHVGLKLSDVFHFLPLAEASEQFARYIKKSLELSPWSNTARKIVERAYKHGVLRKHQTTTWAVV